MYLSDEEKAYLKVIERRVKRYNEVFEHKAILDYTTYIADGNRIDIRLGMRGILSGLTIEQGYWVINGICNYEEV